MHDYKQGRFNFNVKAIALLKLVVAGDEPY